MSEVKKKNNKGWLVLTVITIVAALGLAVTNALTEDVIAQRFLEAAQEARQVLIPSAESFVEDKLPEDSLLDSLFVANTGNKVIGYIAQYTVNGFGGPIEIMVASDTNGKLYGISTGGADFSETAGLGSKVKSPEFTSQYAKKIAPLVLNQDVDQVSGATISSNAVNNGVNEAIVELNKIIPNETVQQ